jgi:hypothetical protein
VLCAAPVRSVPGLHFLRGEAMRVTLENLEPDDLADLEAFTRRCAARRAGPVWEGVGIPRAAPVQPSGGLGEWIERGERRWARVDRDNGQIRLQIGAPQWELCLFERSGEGLPALFRRAVADAGKAGYP